MVRGWKLKRETQRYRIANKEDETGRGKCISSREGKRRATDQDCPHITEPWPQKTLDEIRGEQRIRCDGSYGDGQLAAKHTQSERRRKSKWDRAELRLWRRTAGKKNRAHKGMKEDLGEH